MLCPPLERARVPDREDLKTLDRAEFGELIEDAEPGGRVLRVLKLPVFFELCALVSFRVISFLE